MPNESDWNVEYSAFPRRIPVDTQRCFNVNTTSNDVVRRRINVETTSCVYWDRKLPFRCLIFFMMTEPKDINKEKILQRI